jgi:uncharacterized membrane protein
MPRIHIGQIVAPCWLRTTNVLPNQMSQSRTYLLELIMCAVGVAGMALAYGGRAYAELFWGDETITADAIRANAVDLVINRYSVGHSPLYFLIAKAWMLMATGSEGLVWANEFLLRVPSLVFMGLAGGLLAAAASRAWGIAAGLLLLAMWLTNSFIAYYSIEARPYALLVLFLAITIWSATRLWLAKSQPPLRNFVAISVLAPALAAATMPLGAVAAIAMEACGVCNMSDDPFARFWRRRAFLSITTTVVTFAVFMPTIMNRAASWVDEPLSLRTLGQVANNIYLNDWYSARHGYLVLIASLAILLFAIRALAIAWRELPVRMAAGLAVLCPAALIALSTKASLMSPRYFIPAVPGLLVLAAASVANGPGRNAWPAAAAVTILAMVMTLAFHSPPLTRLFTPELQLALIEKLKPGGLTGGTSSWFVKKTLNYYLPRYTGLPAQISEIEKPLTAEDLPPGNRLYWLFDSFSMAGSAPVLCSYQLKTGNVLVLGRSRAALPASMRNCAAVNP